MAGVGLAGLLAGTMVGAQTLPPLTSQWAPGAIPGGGGIMVSAFPIVTGEPFTADNNSRSIQMRNGEKSVYEAHSMVARDSEGRIAARTPESPHVAFPDGKSAGFIAGGGNITNPADMVEMHWMEVGPPQIKEVVMKYRIPPNAPDTRAHPLDACEREAGHTRNLRNGETQQIAVMGERTIQGILTSGCRVTTLIPAGSLHNDQPITITDESWSSPQLRITLLRIHHDPSGREEIEQLDNIVRGEPDPALFQPPPDYRVRDMDAEREQQEAAQVTLEPGGIDAEMLAGNWEAGDPFAGKPAQIGILLKLLANRRVPYSHGKVTGDGPQKIADLQIRVYQRAAGEDKGGWFTTHGGGADWDGHRLQISFNGNGPGVFIQGQLGLDLAFNEKIPAWTGSYTREGVTKPILLTRPGASREGAPHRFVGGWLENGWIGGARCVYIAQGLDEGFVAWRVSSSGPTINPEEGMNTVTFHENDGDSLGVQIDGDTVTLQEGLYWAGLAGQAPRKFTGRLSPDQSQIVGTWVPDLSRPPDHKENGNTTLTRLNGQGCGSQGTN
jgi:hypothetical protein